MSRRDELAEVAARHIGGGLSPFELWLAEVVISIEERLGALMGAQEDIDTATATISDATSILNTAAPEIQSELGGAGSVDTSQLNAALQPLVSAVQGIQALAPSPSPAPPPGGEGQGTDGGTGSGTDGGV